MRHAANRRGRGLKIAAAIALTLAAGAAGYWTTTGSGAGATTLDSPQAMTWSAGTPTTQVSPGATSAVATVATNQNTNTVHVNSISLDTAQGTGGFAVDGGHSGCALSALSFTTQTNGGSGWTVPAKVGATPGTLTIQMPGALSMNTGAANACQGASFTVYIAAAV